MSSAILVTILSNRIHIIYFDKTIRTPGPLGVYVTNAYLFIHILIPREVWEKCTCTTLHLQNKNMVIEIMAID